MKSTDENRNFFQNLRDEMERFHNHLPPDSALLVFIASPDGKERPVNLIRAIPPDILVCECEDGDAIVQHINQVQLRFSRRFANADSKRPIGFEILPKEVETARQT